MFVLRINAVTIKGLFTLEIENDRLLIAPLANHPRFGSKFAASFAQFSEELFPTAEAVAIDHLSRRRDVLGLVEVARIAARDRESEKGYYYRSDHFELAKEGVPMLYPGGGYDDREKGVAYGMEKSMEYTRDHYHRVTDEYDLRE